MVIMMNGIATETQTAALLLASDGWLGSTHQNKSPNACLLLNIPWKQREKCFYNRKQTKCKLISTSAIHPDMNMNEYDTVYNTSEGFPHQETLTNHKRQTHVLESVLLDNRPLAVRIQEAGENYRQGHGTRCQLNGCPQQYLVTRNTLIYVSNMCNSIIFSIWSHENREREYL